MLKKNYIHDMILLRLSYGVKRNIQKQYHVYRAFTVKKITELVPLESKQCMVAVDLTMG